MGTSVADCAAAVQLDGTSQVGRFRALLKLPDDVRHLIDWGSSGETVAFTAAFEISRLDSSGDQRLAMQATLEQGLSTSEVRQLVQARKRSGKTISECVAVVLKMRPRVETRHVFIASVDGDIRDRLVVLSQQQRNDLLQGILGDKFSDLGAAGRLGVERVTLVGGTKFGDVLKVRKEGLEQQLNAALKAGMSAHHP